MGSLPGQRKAKGSSSSKIIHQSIKEGESKGGQRRIIAAVF